MKVAVGITPTHNPSDELYRASGLRENLTSRSYGEGLETGRATTQAPRQSLTRQLVSNPLASPCWLTCLCFACVITRWSLVNPGVSSSYSMRCGYRP